MTWSDETTDPFVDEYISQVKVSINDEEVEMLRKSMILLRQLKPSTALKQMAQIGLAKMEQDQKMFDFTLENIRRNSRWGQYTTKEISKIVENSLRKVPKI
jgi:hypothetical protein